MAKKKKASSEKIQTRWGIYSNVHRKVAVYQKLYALDSLEEAANVLLDKVTEGIQLPE